MPDTPANRGKYPYPHGQDAGCGFPMVRLNGLIDLSHGGLREFASSDMNASELSNHYELEENLQAGDVFIGDRLYSGYGLIGRLHSKGVHFIGRTHQAGKIDFRRGQKIGPDERLVVWEKPRYKPKGSHLSEEKWEALPVFMIRVRFLKKGSEKCPYRFL